MTLIGVCLQIMASLTPSPPHLNDCKHYFKIGMVYIALGVGAIISKNKEMNSGYTRTMVYRFSIVIEFFLILYSPFLHHFLSQPPQRKSDCSKNRLCSSFALTLFAQLLTLQAQSLDKISSPRCRMGLLESLPFVRDFYSVKGT